MSSQDGLTRQQLDIALLVAEAELIEGLPAYPAPLPLSQSESAELLGGFQQRRVECMASAHAIARAEALDRLQLLEVSVAGLMCGQLLGQPAPPPPPHPPPTPAPRRETNIICASMLS
jgi:hypothetical protein